MYIYIYIDSIYIWVVLDSRSSKIYYSGSPRKMFYTYAFSMFVWLGKRSISRALDFTGTVPGIYMMCIYVFFTYA